MSGANLLVLGGTQAAAPAVYIEDVFSTYLYTGNGSTQTITNNIDLSGEGGLVWIKDRTQTGPYNALFDTVRGATKQLVSNDTSAQFTSANTLTAFLSSGFSIGSDSDVNTNGNKLVSWTFRKAEKFFDVVTYTGNGSNRTISHNLGSVPGCIMVKRTDTTGAWAVYHRSLANTEYLVLNTTAAKATGTTYWNSTTPTSTEFSLGTATDVNANSGTYVAYLFAHDAGGFGDAGSDNVISCGSYTTDSSGNATISLGYEPQWLLVKRTDSTSNWLLMDVMRGQSQTSVNVLYPDSSNAEASYSVGYFPPTATGFNCNAGLGTGVQTHIYIAIRRGPMKTPTSGTSVFTPSTRAGTGASVTTSNLSFPPDAVWSKGQDNGGTNSGAFDRLRGATQQLSLNQTDAETTASTSLTGFDVMTGYTAGADAVQLTINATGYNYVNWQFRRAPGFFDVVCYTGTGSARTISHNLGAVPELMIVKCRSTARAWPVYAASIGNTNELRLNENSASSSTSVWNSTTPTSSVFSLGTPSLGNFSGDTYVAYLFASVSGVSKVGSYTGTGTTLQVNCGFTGGARFVLIKRTDSTGDWYVWDSARGIVAGNDPYLLLNSTAAEVTNTDYVDTYSAGFEISSTAPAAINANGGTFIFLAIA